MYPSIRYISTYYKNIHFARKWLIICACIVFFFIHSRKRQNSLTSFSILLSLACLGNTNLSYLILGQSKTLMIKYFHYGRTPARLHPTNKRQIHLMDFLETRQARTILQYIIANAQNFSRKTFVLNDNVKIYLVSFASFLVHSPRCML